MQLIFVDTEDANPFGDFYAGLVGDFGRSSEWKRLRITKHDHHPVNDAMGNVEAFARMLAGERVKAAKERPCAHCPSPELHDD